MREKNENKIELRFTEKEHYCFYQYLHKTSCYYLDQHIKDIESATRKASIDYIFDSMLFEHVILEIYE